MDKSIIFFIFVILLIALFVSGCGQQTEKENTTANTECPFGLVNDSYPGSCGRYIDADNNWICDNSE